MANRTRGKKRKLLEYSSIGRKKLKPSKKNYPVHQILVKREAERTPPSFGEELKKTPKQTRPLKKGAVAKRKDKN